MKRLILFSLLIQNLFAADFIGYNAIGSVKFTIKDISVLNGASLSPQKKLALIKAYTPTGYSPYNWQNEVYFGVDLSSDDGKSMYSQFEKAYWFQQDVMVRCINGTTDRVILPEPGQPIAQAQTFVYYTPVIVWSE